MHKRHRFPVPLILIALPAAVAIWSGWVGLGEASGFGPINLLPGIGGGFHLNTAITLPVGVEAYAAYALGVWMAGDKVPEDARRFAQWSALGALVYGMAGQVIYHLLAAAGISRAPWPVVVAVSCMPVVVLGCAAALTHLLRQPQGDTAGPVPASLLDRVPADTLEAAELALRATALAGNALSKNQLQERYKLTRAEAGQLMTKVNAESNGHGG